MFRKSRVAWKLSGLFSAIIVLALAATAYVNSLDDRREALASARDVSRTHSGTIIRGLHRFMSTRDVHGIDELIAGLGRDNSVYTDALLVAHEGRIVTSFRKPGVAELEKTIWPCTECHIGTKETLPVSETILESVVSSDTGEDVLSTVTLIRSEPGCVEADCHPANEDGRPIGFLRTDYSLQRVDALVAQHGLKTGLVALMGILICAVASWLAVDRLVGSRLKVLSEGVRRVTARDFNFRFSEGDSDEFGELAHEFNKMIRQSKRTNEYLEGIVEDSADIIITVDPEGIIQKFNTGAERILGYSRDEAIGTRIEMLFADPSERDAAIAHLDYTDHVVNYQTHFLTKDGRRRDVILTLSKLRRRDGTVIGTYGISKDVTREKKLLRQLLQSEKMAALGQAVTGIQHSVKNLLNVLKGGSYMVKTGLAKDDKDLLLEGWKMVQDGIQHMTELSTSMLQFAREHKLKTEENNLAELVRQIHELSEARFREKGVTLTLDLSDPLALVHCDRELIHSVVMDLLSNALDACSWKEYPEGESPEVTLRVRQAPADGYMSIEVSDNGEGIAEEVRKKIFTPFFSTKKKKGTGMGLAVASRVVASHGGKIMVESEAGEGATFRVILPIGGPGQGEERYDVEESVGR
jgi:PAS domain S-box-containing protein